MKLSGCRLALASPPCTLQPSPGPPLGCRPRANLRQATERQLICFRLRELASWSTVKEAHRLPASCSVLFRQTRNYLSRRRRTGLLLDLEQSRFISIVTRSHAEIATGVEVINNLGLDALTFLAATVIFVPSFKAIKASPVSCCPNAPRIGLCPFLALVCSRVELIFFKATT